MPPPIIVACVNLKGGVGKTAIAVNFAAYCGHIGMRTLLVDLDPQTNATFSCISVDDWEDHAAKRGTVADLFGARGHTSAEGKHKNFADVVRIGAFSNVDLIPSHLDLFTIDLDLASATARESKIKKALTPVLNNYDMIVCDCPPNLTIPTQNALAICTNYVVPVSPDYLSAIGVGLLLKEVKKFCGEMDISPTLAGMVISRSGRKALHREQTVSALRASFGSDVLNNELPERVAVSEAVEKHTPIHLYDPQGAGQFFVAVSQELLLRMGYKVSVK